MRPTAWAITVLLLCIQITFLQAASGAEACRARSDLGGVHVDCEHNKDQLGKNFRDPTHPYIYRVEIICNSSVGGGITIGDCGTPEYCNPPDPVFRYRVYRALRESPSEWSLNGTVCLTSPTELTDRVTELLVRRAFQELIWPGATLLLQPPDGETLINFPTIFYTTETQPQTQTVVLLGTTVEIEATPTSWTWHWAQAGDEAAPPDLDPLTTTTPGAPHPDETITHTYSRAGTVRPSVDVTYTGRYRIDDGDWTDIEEPHTVIGTPQPLDILEARPVLIR